MKKYEKMVRTITSEEKGFFVNVLSKAAQPSPYAFMNAWGGMSIIGTKHPEWGSAYSCPEEGIKRGWNPTTLMYELCRVLLEEDKTPHEYLRVVSESEPQFALHHTTKDARDSLKFALIRASFELSFREFKGGDPIPA